MPVWGEICSQPAALGERQLVQEAHIKGVMHLRELLEQEGDGVSVNAKGGRSPRG
jgi:hypothetical protein